MIAGTYSKTGVKHEKNQDSFFACSEGDRGKFIVADGMGGHAAGDVASKMAIEIIGKETDKYTKKSVSEAIAKANTAILNKAAEEKELEGMGTTIAMCIVDKKKITVTHIGDSRVYIIKDGEIKFVTKDHSYVQQLVENGELSEEDAKMHPMKNIITNALGVQDTVTEETTEIEKDFDYIVICSDGVSNLLSDSEIISITEENTPEKAAQVLCETAQKAGSTDDLTAIVIDLKGAAK